MLPRTVTFRGNRGKVLVLQGKNSMWYVVGLQLGHKLAIRLKTTFVNKADALSVAQVIKTKWVALSATDMIDNYKELDRIRERIQDGSVTIVD
jgi:hypothetical protein